MILQAISHYVFTVAKTRTILHFYLILKIF